MAETIIKYNRIKENKKDITSILLNSSAINSQIANNVSNNTNNNSNEVDSNWKVSFGENSLVPKQSLNIAEGANSIAIGTETLTYNEGELAIGMFNSSTSGETFFTVGDGTDDINRHNIFEVGKTYCGFYNSVNFNNNISGTTAVFTTNVKAPTISGSNGIFSSTVKAPTISGTNATITNSVVSNTFSGTSANFNNANISNKLTTDKLEAVSGYIKTLLSDEITVDYLTVTKAAHFFKLIIDEIKATQGQLIITPANAVIDKVDTLSGKYRCYFRAKDNDKEIYNSFKVNDQVVCQTFNAATGVSYNVSNTYYWRLCVATGTTTTTINGETVDCHYIDLSNTDKDTYSISVPKQGDNVVQLGNRTDATRQAAIVISAYNSEFLDKNIKAPSLVQYAGINDYDLSAHRLNIISNGLNQFKGSYNNNNGRNIETIISDSATTLNNSITGLSQSLTNSVNSLSGQISTTNTNVTNLTTDVNTKYNTINTNINSVSGVVSSHTESISALRQTDSDLTSAISANTNSIITVNSNVSALTTTVNGHTTSIGNLNSTVTSHTNSISVLQQTASGLTNTVSSHTSSIATINGTLTSHTNSINSITGDVSNLTTQVNTNKNNINSINNTVSNQGTYITNISGSVSTNTTNISSLQSTVQGLLSTVSSQSTSIATISGDVIGNTQAITNVGDYAADKIGTLSGKVTTNTSNISALQQTANGISATVSSHTSSIADINSSIESLNSSVTANTSSISSLRQTTNSISTIVSSHTQSISTLGSKVDSVSGIATANTSAISTLSQTAEGLATTVATFSHSNLLMGSGDGFGWSYWDGTNVDYNVETGGFNLIDNSDYRIYSPSVYLEANKTYTVSQYNPFGYYFTIKRSTSNVPPQRMSTTVTSTTKSVLYSDIYKSCYRYYQVFTAPADGYYCFIIEDDEEDYPLFYRPQLELGSGCTSFNMAQLISESQIKQSASDITLKVKNCGIDIDAEKVTLNGDTDVKGTLTLSDTTQGFILQGISGTTTISPQSIGTYSNFTSRSTNTVSMSNSSSCFVGFNTTSSRATSEHIFTLNLGTLKSGCYITLTSQTMSFSNGYSSITPYNLQINYKVLQGSTTLATFNKTSSTVSNIGSFTTTAIDNVTVYVKVTATFYSSTFDTITFGERETAVCNMSFKASIPTDAFTLIGYDGVGMNFGTNNNVYFSNDGCYIKYGNNGLKITTAGLQKLDPNGGNKYVNMSTKKVTKVSGSSYTIQDSDEFIVYTNANYDITLNLPTPSSYMGRMIYFKDASNGGAIKLYGSIRGAQDSGGSTQTVSVNNLSVFVISDGSYWNVFTCV